MPRPMKENSYKVVEQLTLNSRTKFCPQVDTRRIINTDGPDLHFQLVPVLPHPAPKRPHF